MSILFPGLIESPWTAYEKTEEIADSVYSFVFQTLGHGRGLEDLFAALPLLEHEAEIHLRGKPVSGFESWLAHRVPKEWRGRMKVHEPVSDAELLSRLASTISVLRERLHLFATRSDRFERKLCIISRWGSLSFQRDCRSAGMAMQAPGCVFLLSGDAPALAARLNRLLESPDALKQAKSAALAAAERRFCWERQEKSLLETIDRALISPTT